MSAFHEDEAWAAFSTVTSHLYGAGHRAQGEHSSTVLNGGLAVKRSLSVDEEHSNLLGRDAPNSHYVANVRPSACSYLDEERNIR